MKKLITFAVLLLVIFGLGIFKLYNALVKGPQDKAESAKHAKTEIVTKTTEVTTATKTPAQPEKPQKPHARIVRALFEFASDPRRLFHEGPPWVRTDTGFYVQGELCEFGMVVGIRAPDLSRPFAVIRIQDDDGETFVICSDRKPVDNASGATYPSEHVKSPRAPAQQANTSSSNGQT